MTEPNYVDLDTMRATNRGFLTTSKHPGLIVKRADVPLSPEDLGRLGAAPLDESAAGDVATGSAVLIGGTYYREYRSYTAAELSTQSLAALAATDADMPRVVEDLINTLIGLGVIAETDLPQAAQDKLANRRSKRAAL
jgi:hypothetical protein